MDNETFAEGFLSLEMLAPIILILVLGVASVAYMNYREGHSQRVTMYMVSGMLLITVSKVAAIGALLAIGLAVLVTILGIGQPTAFVDQVPDLILMVLIPVIVAAGLQGAGRGLLATAQEMTGAPSSNDSTGES